MVTTHDFSTTENTHTYTYGFVSEPFDNTTTPHGTFDAFDYSASNARFTPTHIIVVDRSNDTESNDALIAAAIGS